jgi:hypothetical protein
MSSPRPRTRALAFALLAALTLLACSPKPPSPPSGAAAASIQELMATKVDPAADALWEAVSSETTAGGVEEQQPRTDQQWQAVRKHALVLIEAAGLLGVDGRPVTQPGSTSTSGVMLISLSTSALPLPVEKAIMRRLRQDRPVPARASVSVRVRA